MAVYFLTLIIISSAVCALHNTPPDLVLKLQGARNRGEPNRIRRVMGGFFPIHISELGSVQCSEPIIFKSVERLENMLYAVDGFKGIVDSDIRDNQIIALDENDELVFSNEQTFLLTCQSNIIATTLLYHVKSQLNELQLVQSQMTTKKCFLWIASDLWKETINATKYSDSLLGMWRFVPFNEDSFSDYFSQLCPVNNVCNPWVQELANFIFDINCTNTAITGGVDYNQNTRVPNKTDSVYILPHDINIFLVDQLTACHSKDRVCQGGNVSQFTDQRLHVIFDYMGNIEDLVKILNYNPYLGQNYNKIISSTECQMCSQYMWGNDPLTGNNGCIDVEESYLKPFDASSIILVVLAIIGLLAVVFVSGGFIYFWNTPIVKSSGREQMILLPTGITLCFLITVIFIPKPSVSVFTLQRMGAWFCFALIISSLFFKLVKLCRLLTMHRTIFSFFVLSQLLLLTESAVQYHYGTPPGSVLRVRGDRGTRISGIQNREDKDIILGGLLRAHSHDPASGGGKCGEIFIDTSIENMEAMFFAIDLINSDPHLLPNITLGYDIRDTCISENIALDESVDLTLSNGRLELESCQGSQSSNVSTKPPVIAVIGAVDSSISIPVASLFRLFKVPQISYSSTSPLLNNRDRYTYFYRTVPPDNQQARAMVDLILHFGWYHVSTIYSNNLYGLPGINEFRLLAEANGVCIDFNKGIEENYIKSNYTFLANKLMNTTAKVVVLFASSHHVEMLLTEVQALYSSGTSKRRFLWIASDTWSNDFDAKYKEITIGKWGTAPYSETVPSFDDYYSQLTPATNLRNPWFTEFYERYYDCRSGVNCSNSSVTNDPNYQQDFFDSFVIDAVYSLAHAIHNILNDSCEHPIVWYRQNQTCLGQSQEFNGENLLKYIKDLNFKSPSGNHINFDEEGNVKAKYRIYNYQVKLCENCIKTFEIVDVGHWDGSASQNRLRLKSNVTKQFGLNESGHIIYQLKSQCQVCSPGFFKREIASLCCGICEPCLGQNYTNTTSSKECQMCPQSMWGNDPLTGSNGCVDIEESYLKPSDGWSIVLILLAIIGLLAVVFVNGVFIYFWNTPIVKSSGREQMILLLSGITLCFLITVVFILKPSVAVCTLQRIGAWLCFSLIISALFIKLVRITRIFLNKNISTSPKCISPMYQILFTFLLVGVEMVFLLISLNVVHPGVVKNQVNDTQNTNNFPILALQCTTPHIAFLVIQMLYLSALMIASNGLAILTIRFPQNFNESRYVAFSTFSLGLIWIAFIMTYLATDSQFQPAVISLSIQLSALAVLVCLFGPRAFIMIVWPSQNVLTTSTSHSTQVLEKTS